MHIEVRVCPRCGFGIYSRGKDDTMNCKCGRLCVGNGYLGDERTWRPEWMESIVDKRNVLTDFIDNENITVEKLNHDMTLKRSRLGRVKFVNVDIDWGMFDTLQQYLIERGVMHLIRKIVDNNFKIDRIWIDDWEDHGTQYAFKFDWADGVEIPFKKPDNVDMIDILSSGGVWDKMSNAAAAGFKEVQADIDKFHVYVFMEAPVTQREEKESGRPRKLRERRKIGFNSKKKSTKSSKN